MSEDLSRLRQLSIVIPLYNAVDQVTGLLDQLALLKQQSGGAMQVVLADDASPDGTAKWARHYYPQFDVVANEENQGFGANVMSGVQAARQPWLATLNSDVELLGNPFPVLLDALVHTPTLFAAMPLIWNSGIGKVENLHRLYAHRGLCWHTELAEEKQWSELLGAVLESGGGQDWSLARQARTTGAITAVLCGAAFVCSRQRFLELGGFSPRYRPFYWEDVDLGYRALARGWSCATLPAAAVLHRHSESINKLGEARKMRSLLINQLRFVIDHGSLLPELKYPRLWWALRSLREKLRKDGDEELGKLYWRAAKGEKDV